MPVACAPVRPGGRIDPGRPEGLCPLPVHDIESTRGNIMPPSRSPARRAVLTGVRPRCRHGGPRRLQHDGKRARRSRRQGRGGARRPVPAGAGGTRPRRQLRRLPDLPERDPGCLHLRRPVRQRRPVRGRQGGRVSITSPVARGACRPARRTSPRPISSRRRRRWRRSGRRAAWSWGRRRLRRRQSRRVGCHQHLDPAEAGDRVRLRATGAVRRRERGGAEDHGAERRVGRPAIGDGRLPSRRERRGLPRS